MKGKELHNMTDEELKSKLGELKSELFNLRFRHASGQLDNPMTIAAYKKEIASVNTVLRERELKAKM